MKVEQIVNYARMPGLFPVELKLERAGEEFLVEMWCDSICILKAVLGIASSHTWLGVRNGVTILESCLAAS